jgi:hypothetical protein
MIMIDFLTNSDAEVILGAISVMLALVAIVQTYRINKFNTRAAHFKGTFKKPNIDFRIFSSPLSGTDAIDHFILACHLPKGTALVFPLVTTVINLGDKSAKDVKLLLRYPKRLRGGGMVDEIKYSGPDFIKSDILEDSNYQTTLITIGSLAPKQPIGVEDPIMITESSLIESSVSVTTSDKKTVSMSYRLTYFNLIDFTVYQEDEEPLSGRIKLLVINTAERPLQETLKIINEDYQKRYSERMGTGFRGTLNYFKLRLSGAQISKRVLLIFYDESTTKKQPDPKISEVPAEALKGYHGITDITGSLYIANINL